MTSAPNPFDAPAADDAFGPYGAAIEHEDMILAERGTRLASSITDSVLYVGAVVPGIAFMVMKMEEVGWAVGGLLLAAMTGYQWYLISTTGQSIAKKWFKIKIVREDGSPVDFVHGVILRVWTIVGLGFVPLVGNFIGLVDALMILGDERQCLHDRIAKTKVVTIQY